MKENANERFGRSDVMGIDHLLSKRRGEEGTPRSRAVAFSTTCRSDSEGRPSESECAEVAGWIDREDRLVDERNPSQMERRGVAEPGALPPSLHGSPCLLHHLSGWREPPSTPLD